MIKIFNVFINFSLFLGGTRKKIWSRNEEILSTNNSKGKNFDRENSGVKNFEQKNSEPKILGNFMKHKFWQKNSGGKNVGEKIQRPKIFTKNSPGTKVLTQKIEDDNSERNVNRKLHSEKAENQDILFTGI